MKFITASALCLVGVCAVISVQAAPAAPAIVGGNVIIPCSRLLEMATPEFKRQADIEAKRLADAPRIGALYARVRAMIVACEAQ